MRIRIDSSAEVTTKLRGLLAGEKCLRGQWFLTNQRIEPAGRQQMPPPARKVPERSLKIEYLQEAGDSALLRARPLNCANHDRFDADHFWGFRATQSAATELRGVGRGREEFKRGIPRYSERGH